MEEIESNNNNKNSNGVLPITTTTTTTTRTTSPKKLTLVPLIFLIYFEVAGGPYGEEPAVKAAGPLLALVGFLVFPFIWSVPEALITAELSTAFPGNGGFVIWAERAFGPFWGSMMGTWKFLSGVINIAAFPLLCVDYLEKLVPALSSGWPRVTSVLASTAVLSFLNYTGLAVVGYAAVALGVVSLSPFVLMSLIAVPKIRPRRWLSLGQKGVKRDWNLYFNTLFWNLNFWDNVSTLAGEVEDPQKNFPRALFSAVVFTCVSYLVPLFAVTGAVAVDQDRWDTGFHAEAAEIIAGKWLQVWLEIGAVLSAIGLFEAQLSSSAYQVLGMSSTGMIPELFARRSRRFGTPSVAILISAAMALAISYMNFTVIISSANFLYSLGMLLEFASFVWLRRKMPGLKRPYRVPMGVPGLVAMCAVPSGFLIFVMAIATKTVFLISGVMTAAGIGWFFLMRLCKAKKWFKFSSASPSSENVDNNHDQLNQQG